MTQLQRRLRGITSFAAALGGSLLLSPDALPAASAAKAVAPDLEVVSVAVSHTELAPGSALMLTVALRASGASVGPFTVATYYDDGAPRPGSIPKTAQLLDTYPVSRGLSKGATTAFNVPVRIPPCDACGPRALYVVADAAGLLLDVNRNNNVRAVALDVAKDHLPDLRVTDVALDADRGSTSDEVRVRGTVRNDSRYFAEGPFRVSIYCSADRTLTARDHRLFSFTVDSLGPKQSIGVDRTVKLVPECGVYAASTWLGILADDQDALPESNEQNDDGAKPFWVFRSPDLTSRPVALSATAGPVGSRVLVSYRIGNQGGSAAGAFRTGVYLARPGEKLTHGTLLDAVSVPSLGANTDSGLMQHLVTIPKVPRGRYSLGVWVDVDGENGELHRRNNFQADPFDVTEINLTDVYFTAQQKEVGPGQSLDVKIAVRNTGKDAAPPTKIGLYYSDDPRFDRGEDIRVGELDLDKIAGGAATREKATTVTIPKTAREGYRFLVAVMDDEGIVAETDERDNAALEPILVMVGDPEARAAR